MTESGHRLNKLKIATIVTALFIVATLAFIWGNSLESVVVPSGKSRRLLKCATIVLGPMFGKGNVTDYLVRKFAHFTEFGLLGVWLALFVIMRGRSRIQSIVNCLILNKYLNL